MEMEYSAEEYPIEIPLEKKTKLISKTKLGKTTLLNPNRKYIPPENEIINENSPLENKKDTIGNDIENEEAIIINNDIPNLRNMKETKATFLIKTIIKAYYLSLWKRQIRSIKYSTRGYNPQRVNFKKFIKALSSVIKQHKFDYFNEICKNMDSLPMPEHINHDNNFGTLKFVSKELLYKKYSDKISKWAENNYDKKINGFKKYLLESFKKMKENNELYGQININGSRETDYSNYKIYNPSEETISSKGNGKINIQPMNINERDYNKENINRNIYINENLDNKDNENYINEKYFNNYNNNIINNNIVQHNINKQYYNNDYNNNYNNDEVLDTDEQNQENIKKYQYEDTNNNYIDKNNNIYIENNNYMQNNNYIEENNLGPQINNYINEKKNNNFMDDNFFYNEEDNEEKENDYNNNDYVDSEYIESDYKRSIDKKEDKENDYNNNDYENKDYNENNYNEQIFNENNYNEIHYNDNNYNYEDNYKFIDNNYEEENYDNNNYENNYINNNYEINNYDNYDNYDITYEKNNYNNYENEEEEDYINNYEHNKYPQEYNYDYVENDEDNYNNYSNDEYDNDYINDNDNNIQYNEEEDYYFEEPKQQEFENKEVVYYLPYNNQREKGFRYITNERNNSIVSDVYTKPIVTNNHSQIRIYNFSNSGLNNNKFKYFKKEYIVENYGIGNLNGYKKYTRAFPSRSDNHSFYISK